MVAAGAKGQRNAGLLYWTVVTVVHVPRLATSAYAGAPIALVSASAAVVGGMADWSLAIAGSPQWLPSPGMADAMADGDCGPGFALHRAVWLFSFLSFLVFSFSFFSSFSLSLSLFPQLADLSRGRVRLLCCLFCP